MCIRWSFCVGSCISTGCLRQENGSVSLPRFLFNDYTKTVSWARDRRTACTPVKTRKNASSRTHSLNLVLFYAPGRWLSHAISKRDGISSRRAVYCLCDRPFAKVSRGTFSASLYCWLICFVFSKRGVSTHECCGKFESRAVKHNQRTEDTPSWYTAR